MLPNGQVLVTGGVGRIVGLTGSVDLYDAATGSNQPTASLNMLRRNHTATLLLNGKVLVAGGCGGEMEWSWSPVGETAAAHSSALRF